jgi:anti-sigma-K factor RskA
MSDLFGVPDDDPALDALGRALPRVAPPADMFDRILAATAGQSEPRRRTDPRVRPRRRRGWLPVFAAAAAAAAATAAITVSLETGKSLGRASADAAVASQGGGDRVSGTAALYHPDSPGGQIRLVLRKVPAPPHGAHYELWLLPEGSRQMTAVASFTPAGATVDLLLPIPAPGRYAALDISVQPNNGPPARTQTSLAGGTFLSAR